MHGSEESCGSLDQLHGGGSIRSSQQRVQLLQRFLPSHGTLHGVSGRQADPKSERDRCGTVWQSRQQQQGDSPRLQRQRQRKASEAAAPTTTPGPSERPACTDQHCSALGAAVMGLGGPGDGARQCGNSWEGCGGRDTDWKASAGH